MARAADRYVCELSPLLDASDRAVGHALSELAGAWPSARRKEGEWRSYRTTDRAEYLLAALEEEMAADGGGDG